MRTGWERILSREGEGTRIPVTRRKRTVVSSPYGGSLGTDEDSSSRVVVLGSSRGSSLGDAGGMDLSDSMSDIVDSRWDVNRLSLRD